MAFGQGTCSSNGGVSVVEGKCVVDTQQQEMIRLFTAGNGNASGCSYEVTLDAILAT
eukprot:COSAG01_NODE_5182_length_4426_cov_299.396580_3_plen_57_part_00